MTFSLYTCQGTLYINIFSYSVPFVKFYGVLGAIICFSSNLRRFSKEQGSSCLAYFILTVCPFTIIVSSMFCPFLNVFRRDTTTTQIRFTMKRIFSTNVRVEVCA